MGGKGRTTINQPDPIDPGKAMGEYLFGRGFGNFQGVTDPRLQERLIGAEERFRPRYAALELRDIATFAKGTGGTPGLFDLLEESGRTASEMQRESLQAQRAADVAALQEFAPQVTQAYRTADPFSARLADLQLAQAEQLYASADQLSPEQQRMVDQQARSGSLARGRITDESSVAAEILGRERFKSTLRGEARQAGQLAFGQSRALAGDIGMSILGRPSAGLALGGNVLGQAQGQAAGPMGPQLFDPNVGINMAMQQRSQDMSLLGAQAQADATRSAGMMSALGGVAGGFLGGTGFAKMIT